MSKSRSKPPELLKPPAQLRKWVVIGMWLIFLGVVIVSISKVLPGGRAGSPLGGRDAESSMQTARGMSAEGLWHGAAEIYERLSRDDRLGSDALLAAATELATLYEEKLGHPEKAGIALERAIYFASKPHEKNQLKARLKTLRRNSGLSARSAARRRSVRPASTSVPIAKVGSRTVTLDEILYAWNREHPGESPPAEKMAEFTQEYMTKTMLAEEARIREIDRKPTYQRELDYYEMELLSRTIRQSLITDVNEAEIQQHYLANLTQYMEPPAASLQHIVVLTPEEGAAVGERLDAGEDFAAVAADVSLDKDSITSGTELGWIDNSSTFIPYVGAMGPLAEALLKYDDGVTTGPIQGPRGYHWFRIAAKRDAIPRPLESVREQVRNDLIRLRFQKAHEELLAELKERIPASIDLKALENAIAKASATKSAGVQDRNAPSRDTPSDRPVGDGAQTDPSESTSPESSAPSEEPASVP